MSNSISFNCMHCKDLIEADLEFAGQEVNCPGCSKTIIVPKSESNTRDALLKKYPDLKNRSEKELDSSIGFLDEYFQVYCEVKPSEDQQMRVVSIAFKEGVGKAMVKRYENATFASTMQGSQRDSKKIQDSLFGNKKLNKQLDKILNLSGIKRKKKGFLGIFG